MGYAAKRKVYKLVFEQHELEGLEVRARSVSTGKIIALGRLAQGGDKPRNVEAFEELLEGFAAALVDWNLEDEDGVPVPATVEGLHSQDPDLVFSIILAWMDAVSGVSGPLDRPSTSGVQFPEASIPMDVLSGSL